MKPTIGRIVHYWRNVGGEVRTPMGYTTRPRQMKCFAAIITDVKYVTRQDAKLNFVETADVYLQVFGRDIAGQDNVLVEPVHFAPSADTGSDSFWTWPPRES